MRWQDEDLRELLSNAEPRELKVPRPYQYNRFPFGILSSPAIFQQEMDKVLHGISIHGRDFTLTMPGPVWAV